MIVIGSKHYQAAKSQAHSLRDHLINSWALDLEGHQLLKKSAFLNVWGKCLGYLDWNDFMHAACSRHISSAQNTIISPDKIVNLAVSLSNSLYLHQDDAAEIERQLFVVALPHEKALFTAADREYYSVEPGSEDNPIKLELGPSRQVLFLLKLLMSYHNAFREFKATRFKKMLLDEAKAVRKDKAYNKAYARSEGVDIYENSGCRVDSLISEAIHDGWIEQELSFEDREPTTVIRLASRGSRWLFSYLTESEIGRWINWNMDVDSALKTSNRGRRVEQEFDRLNAFSSLKPVEEYVERVLDPPAYKMSESMDNSLKALTKAIAADIEEYNHNDEVFHLTPRLFMSEAEFRARVKPSELTLRVSMQVFDAQGSSLQVLNNFDFHLEQPYPNKRHIVGIGSHGHMGQFISIPDGASRIEICYVWVDGLRKRKTTHSQTFRLQRQVGNRIFSGSSTWSFLDVIAITGCATTQEEILTLRRFRENITHISSEPNSGEWNRLSELHEEMIIDSSSHAGLRFLLS